MEWLSGLVESNDLFGNKFRWLKIQPGEDLDFKVGQYILLKVSNQKENSYSICSLPGDELLEIIVDVEPAKEPPPKGEGSRYINDLKPGDKVTFSGPYGKFTLRDDGTTYRVFVATGSGLSSILPMAEEACQDIGCRVILFWGLRYRENIFMEEKLAWLKERYLNFHYEIVLSSADDNWQGKTGHVTENIKEWLSGGDLDLEREVSVYLCGNDRMIKDVSSILQEIGVPKERVYYEKYYEESEEANSEDLGEKGNI